jgi:transglutaminase superfamily protein
VTAPGLLRRSVRMLEAPSAGRGRIAEAAIALTLVSLELRLLPTERTAIRLEPLRTDDPDEGAGEAALREATMVGPAVAAAARHLPWHPTCLRQALAAQRMLRRRGIANRLHLGVTSVDDFRPHAWVAVGGHPIVGSQGLERFVDVGAFESAAIQALR